MARVMRPPDHDRHGDPLDAALSTLLRSRSSQPQGCDAELAAAFAEGRLRGEEKERFQSHIADCARCRQLTTELLEDNLSAGAAPRPALGWQWWSWRWAAPVMAGGLIAVSAVYYQIEQTRPLALDQKSDMPVEVAEAGKAEPAPKPTDATAPVPASRAEKPVPRRPQAPQPSQEALIAHKAIPPIQPDFSAGRSVGGERDERGQSQLRTPAEPRANELRVVNDRESDRLDANKIQQASQRAAATAAPRETGNVAALTEKSEEARKSDQETANLAVLTKEKSEEAGQDQKKEDQKQEAAGGAVGGSLVGLRSADRQLAAKSYRLPDGAPVTHFAVSGNRIWAVSTAGRVYRSLDGGKTWVKLPSPTTADLVRVELESETMLKVVDARGVEHKLSVR